MLQKSWFCSLAYIECSILINMDCNSHTKSIWVMGNFCGSIVYEILLYSIYYFLILHCMTHYYILTSNQCEILPPYLSDHLLHINKYWTIKLSYSSPVHLTEASHYQNMCSRQSSCDSERTVKIHCCGRSACFWVMYDKFLIYDNCPWLICLEWGTTQHVGISWEITQYSKTCLKQYWWDRGVGIELGTVIH